MAKRWRSESTSRESSASDAGAALTRQPDWTGGKKMADSVNRGGMLLAFAVTGLLTLAAPVGTATADDAAKVNCYGVKNCKGTGDCGGKGHSCAGENACKGQGYLDLDKETCLKIEGGILTSVMELG